MTSDTNIKTYTRSEVLLHNKKTDCWVIIENNVYDLTSFIKIHPGGADIIMSRAGEDASSYFTMKHGLNKSVIRQLEQYKIGVLSKQENISENITKEDFTVELLKEIQAKNLYSIDKRSKLVFSSFRFFAVLLFFSLSITALYLKLPIYISVVFIVLQAFIATSLFGLIAHESTHRNFPKNKLYKVLLELFWPVFWPFISKAPLNYEHNSHHIKIGDEDHDFEVAGFAQFIRYSSTIKNNKVHKFQHKLALFFYPFYANIITTIGGVKSQFWQKHNRSVALYHSASLVITFGYYVVLPSIILGFSLKWFLFYLIYQCVLFTGVYLGAAINHFIPSSLKKMNPTKEENYAYYICHHTSNFGATNPLWFWFTGGFNIQIEHHLAPFVPVENLRKLIPIVKNLCKKNQYPYNDFKTFNAMWQAHYEYLEILGSKDVTEEIQNKKAYMAK